MVANMRWGIISDIHGNLPALLRVLRHLREAKVDRIFSLGDLVGYNAHPNHCVRVIRDLGIESIAGNHDLIAIGRLDPTTCAFRPAFALRHTRTTISEDVRRYLQDLPTHRMLPGQIALVHGSPGQVSKYVRSPEDLRRAARALATLEPSARVCFFGHTHEPGVFHVNGDEVHQYAMARQLHLEEGPGIVFINPGSVDAARRPKREAELAIFDPDKRTIDFHAVGYNHEVAESLARTRGYRMPVWREAAHSTWHWGWRAAVRGVWFAVKRVAALGG
jgi:predicted phosphodiesterase